MQDSTSGCPKTLEVAFYLAVIEERSIELEQGRKTKRTKIEECTTTSDDKESTNEESIDMDEDSNRNPIPFPEIDYENSQSTSFHW